MTLGCGMSKLREISKYLRQLHMGLKQCNVSEIGDEMVK